MFYHLFWDMGGTMFDTYPQVDEMLARVVRGRGHEVTNVEVAHLTRRSTRTAIIELSARFQIPPSVFREAEAELKERWLTAPPPPMPGLAQVMHAVRNAPVPGLNLVVTHRDRRSAMALLEAQNIAVDDLICPEDGFARKPDPGMYLHLIERHGLEPSQCLAVGDRPLDAEAAHAAGITAAMIITPNLDLDPGPADFEIAQLTDLLPHLG